QDFLRGLLVRPEVRLRSLLFEPTQLLALRRYIKETSRAARRARAGLRPARAGRGLRCHSTAKLSTFNLRNKNASRKILWLGSSSQHQRDGEHPDEGICGRERVTEAAVKGFPSL